jgi:hypothetical protein
VFIHFHGSPVSASLGDGNFSSIPLLGQGGYRQPHEGRSDDGEVGGDCTHSSGREETPKNMEHVYNPSYSGGRDQEDLGSKPAQA